ncbi:hypothetical protein EYF80_026806 [Liparis tanakae]|uniref:Uncharacterized protein n=1 Tax=Liparis tanakae TaxID=230148 RepID=A0A4Z2HAS1_9TELE|nr:hypothetical protein EYF80_026806 [Liparis tanakae]
MLREYTLISTNLVKETTLLPRLYPGTPRVSSQQHTYTFADSPGQPRMTPRRECFDPPLTTTHTPIFAPRISHQPRHLPAAPKGLSPPDLSAEGCGEIIIGVIIEVATETTHFSSITAGQSDHEMVFPVITDSQAEISLNDHRATALNHGTQDGNPSFTSHTSSALQVILLQDKDVPPGKPGKRSHDEAGSPPANWQQLLINVVTFGEAPGARVTRDNSNRVLGGDSGAREIILGLELSTLVRLEIDHHSAATPIDTTLEPEGAENSLVEPLGLPAGSLRPLICRFPADDRALTARAQDSIPHFAHISILAARLSTHNPLGARLADTCLLAVFVRPEVLLWVIHFLTKFTKQHLKMMRLLILCLLLMLPAAPGLDDDDEDSLIEKALLLVRRHLKNRQQGRQSFRRGVSISGDSPSCYIKIATDSHETLTDRETSASRPERLQSDISPENECRTNKSRSSESRSGCSSSAVEPHLSLVGVPAMKTRPLNMECHCEGLAFHGQKTASRSIFVSN